MTCKSSGRRSGPASAAREAREEIAHLETLLLTSGGILGLAGPAFADEELAEVTEAAKEVAEAAPAEAEGNPILKYGLLFAPLILYSLFALYRSIDPKAKISDFVFYTLGAVVVGNLVSIIFFKTRFF